MLRAFALLLLTFLIELPSTVVRFFVLSFIGVIFLASTTNSFVFLLGMVIFWILVLLPMIVAGAALIWPNDILTAPLMGARKPSQREQEAINAATSELIDPGPMPRNWYVVDAPTANAYVVGNNIYIERELIRTPYLAPIIAHELGHLNSIDGRVMLALRRVSLPAQLAFGTAQKGLIKADGQTRTGCVGCIAALPVLFFMLFGGGWGLRLSRPLWFMWMRDREYTADAYAARTGQGPQLAEALEELALTVDAAVPFMMGRTHPYTELRIDRLLRPDHGTMQTA